MNLHHPQTEPQLTASERTAMKQEFLQYLDANPETIHPAGIPSPYRFFFSTPFLSGTMAVITLMIGTAFAAESALPTQPLYIIKTNFNEDVLMRGTAFTPTAVSRVNTDIIDRRLEEARLLSEAQQLTPELAQHISSELDEKIFSVHEQLRVEISGGNLATALETGRELESTLEAHATLLGGASSDKESGELAASVASDSDQTSDLVDAATLSFATKNGDALPSYTSALFTEIQLILQAQEARFVEHPRPAEEPALHIEGLFAETHLLSQAVSEHLEKQGYSEALAPLQQASENMLEVKIILDALGS